MKFPLTCYPGMNKLALDERNLGVRRQSRRSGIQSGGFATALLNSNAQWGIHPTIHENALTIVCGQQVGFAGGPLYTLAKLASMVRIKRDLEKQGIAVNAYFWLATEDHDFDEVAQLNVPAALVSREKDVNRQRDLVCIRAVRQTGSRAVVGSLPVPEELTTRLLALFDIPRPSWLREGITFRDSFAELIAGVSGNEVILVDALLPELRRAGASLFEQIRAREPEIQRTLHERAQQLEAAGYKEQVVPRDGDKYTLLYEIDEHGNRQQPSNPATQQPERTSTSALTRPLLQDHVLQPDIFLGGPAEMAYYAQLAPVHALLGIAMPRVALRGHVLVAPARVVKTFERYGLDPCSVFRSADELLAEREPEGVARIRAIAEEAKHELVKRVEQIGELALPADHSLAGSIRRSVGHLDYHANKLAERAIKGLVRKDRERYASVRELVSTLYPDRHVQDRIASWFAYRIHHPDLFERIVAEVEPDSPVVRIVSL